jgi:hypothetical protein
MEHGAWGMGHGEKKCLKLQMPEMPKITGRRAEGGKREA